MVLEIHHQYLKIKELQVVTVLHQEYATTAVDFVYTFVGKLLKFFFYLIINLTACY